ncbi:MAG TPA: hypothetical protein VHB50_11690 [Bryobacteraceae bacterium]|nr:hypothetical protein [Bryobacteraceae bacterium]
MWIVLCSSHDTAAMWAFEGLRRRGLAPLELVTTEALAYSRLWEHRIGGDGAHIRIGLQDGRMLCSSRIRGALNRVLTPAQDLLRHAVPSDRDYAFAEMQAFYLSWLKALPGAVIGTPMPLGMSGAWLHASEWAVKASEAGFNVPRYRQSGRDPVERGYFPLAPADALRTSVVVLGNEVFGPPVPGAVQRACARLARLVGTDLLGVDLYQGERGAWLFSGASPAPYLPDGGDALLEHMAGLLKKGECQ